MTKRSKLLAMAALLVLPLAACDEGTGTSPDVNGTITGTVTVDGTARAGATVTLSSGGTATTSAAGTFTFADVPAGAYVVTVSPISGVAFASPSQTATIATAGQAVTVNFAGSAIKTSVVAVSVQGSSGPLAGVTVSLTGAGSGTQTTGVGGLASFTGLAAGNYTVTLSGVPAGQVCATPSQSTTVAAGETRSLSFSCASSTTASITGRMFRDENDRNNVFDGSGLEDNHAAANVLISLEGPTIGVIQTTQTDADGNFAFLNLAEGSYNVTIDSDDPDLPATGFVYGLSSETIGPIMLAAGGTATANFPFDITVQTILAYAFLGRDSNDAQNVDPSIPTGVAALKGVIVELYATEDDLDNLANRIARDTTDANGEVQLTFDRSADKSPGGGPDNIVFLRYRGGPAGYSRNGEREVEIKFPSRYASWMAQDTFDLLNTTAQIMVEVKGINGEELPGWNLRLYGDTTAAQIASGVSDADGMKTYTVVTPIGMLPGSFYVRLANAQAAAGTHAFQTTPTPGPQSAAAGRFIKFTHSGTTLLADTADMGDLTVKFLDSDVMVRNYHENDDTVGFTTLDNTAGTGGTTVTLNWYDADEDADSMRMATPIAGTGLATFLNVPTEQDSYWLSAVGSGVSEILEEDTLTMVGTGGVYGDLLGGTPTAFVCPLGGEDGTDCATFAYKFGNGVITGRVRSMPPINTPIEGASVRIQAHSMTIQPIPMDTVVSTNEFGRFRLEDVREGYYVVSLEGDVFDDDGNTLWAFVDQAPDTVELRGNGTTIQSNFRGTFQNTSIQGVVVNDRDVDTNTIDGGEALAQVTVNLYKDNSGTATVDADSLVAVDETDANGAYGFSGLPEGVYIVEVEQSVAGAVVLRSYDGSGDPVETVTVTTTAAVPATSCTDMDMLSRVGVNDPTCFSAGNPLPRWDYATSAALNVMMPHFTFLYSTGTATGQITDSGDGDPVVGMTVTISRCLLSASQPSPPRAGGCVSFFPGFTPVTTTTNSNGVYSFSGLEEGVYAVEPFAASAGYSDVDATNPGGSTADRMRFTLSGDNDVETGDFTADP